MHDMPLLKPSGAKLAGRAGAAAIAPGMTLATLAAIAGVGVLDHQFDESLPAEALGKLPGLCLRQPHQRSLDHEGDFGAEPDRLSKRTQCRVAAVRIT